MVRAPPEGIGVRPGRAGTGKTAVALHRAAYLLYTHRDRISRDSGVLLIGPATGAFLSLHRARSFLPRRDRRRRRRPSSRCSADATGPGGVRATDPAAARPAQGRRPPGRGASRRAVWAHVAPADRGLLVLPRGIHAVAGRRPTSPTRSSPSSATAACATRPAATMLAAAARPPGAAARWRPPATPPTTACRTRWRAAARSRRTSPGSGPPLDPRQAGAAAADRRRRSWPRRPTAC